MGIAYESAQIISFENLLNFTVVFLNLVIRHKIPRYQDTKIPRYKVGRLFVHRLLHKLRVSRDGCVLSGWACMMILALGWI